MKKLVLLTTGLLFASSSAFAAGDNSQQAAATGANETVKIMVVDKTRKPFKRSFETYTVTEIAALEEARSDVASTGDRLFAKRLGR